MKFYTAFLGCKINQIEIQGIKELLIKNNWKDTENIEDADIAVINTCTVTEKAAAKSRQLIRNIKKTNPDIKIAACGCYIDEQKEEILKVNEIDYFIGNDQKKDILEIIGKEIKLNILKEKNSFEFLPITDFSNKTRAFIKIQDGCSSFCSYCIIPHLRGRSRSLEPSLVLEQVKNLINNGIKEIVLSGIHIGMYGRDLKEKVDFSSLVEEILSLKGDYRIRLSSIEPKEIDSKLINLIKTNDKLCPFLHIPLQAGHNKTLKEMNRKYSVEEYREIIERIRAEIPDISLSTDIIVGFPGESGDIFDDSLQLYSEIGFSNIHMFSFSAKKGTKAYDMNDQIDKNEIKKRIKRLKRSAELSREKYLKQIIKNEAKVLTEQLKQNYFIGKTERYIPVLIEKSNNIKINQFVKVKLQLKDKKIYGIQI